MNKEEKISLKNISVSIKDELECFESELETNFQSEVKFLQPLCDHMKSGKGKRIRPILFFLIQGLCGQPDVNTVAIPVFLEILHTATLIHDDVIDKALKRRETKTINVLWGNKTAILFGDYLFAKVLELGVATRNFKILEFIVSVVKKISEGELRQAFKSQEIKENVYYDIIRDKTAALFKVSCMLAGLSQSLKEEDIIRLGNFGELFGMAYQIKDDILDISGKTKLLGKSSQQDLSDGKFTLPFIIVYTRASKKEKKYLQDIISEGSAEGLKTAYAFIDKNRGLELTEKELMSISREAEKILKDFNPSIYRDSLESLLEYNYLRKS
ncbi:MAG: polyprenyl synthetase family protein [bacterium]